jgi:hypothetical protein
VGSDDSNIKFKTYVRPYLYYYDDDDDDDDNNNNNNNDVCWFPLLYVGILSLLFCGTEALCDH